jgi:ankyrin repeat protein
MRIFSHCIPQIFSDKDKKINSSPTRRSSSESPINPGRVADLQTFSSGTSLPVSGAKRGVLPGKNFIRKAKKKLRDLSAFMTQPIAKSIGIRAKVNPETHQVSNKPMPFLDYRDFQIDIRNLRLSKKITGYSRDDTFHSPEKINVKINLAAFKNNLAALEALLKMPGADPNKQDGQGYNPLLWASINRQVDAVKTLLKSPFIDVNVRDPDGFTPLMHACSNGDIQTVRALLSQPSKVQPHLAAHNGDTALIIAARKGHSDIIEVLLSHPKIEVNLCNSAGRSPLMIAALQGQLDCTQKLLQIPEIDINAEDQDGNTALMWASATGQLDVIDMLLEREDLDPSITNKSGFKAFEIAIRSGNFELSRVLSDALQKSKVLKRIESQLDSFSSEQITRLLEEGFISSERPQALQAMRLLTQYGNMKSLNHLQHWLLKMRRSGFSVLSNHEATLGSTMAYLTAKERGNPAPGGNYHPFKQDGVFRLPINCRPTPS